MIALEALNRYETHLLRTLADNAYTGALALEFLPATEAAITAGRDWVQARL